MDGEPSSSYSPSYTKRIKREVAANIRKRVAESERDPVVPFDRPDGCIPLADPVPEVAAYVDLDNEDEDEEEYVDAEDIEQFFDPSEDDHQSEEDQDYDDFEDYEEDDRDKKRTEYLDALRSWALDANIPHLQLSKLLKIHKSYLPFPIPACARTLLKIPKFAKNITPVDEGHALYLGIQECLLGLPESVAKLGRIQGQFGMDGYSSSESKSNTAWPIIMYIVGSNIKPFPISNYVGRKSPKDLNKF